MLNNNLHNDQLRVKENLEIQKQIRQKTLEAFGNYKRTMDFLACDIHISALCVDKNIQKVLQELGFERVHELRSVDLSKIEGLDYSSRNVLAASLQQFFAMLD